MAKKLTKRKAFNFLRSYFDVLNEIPEDKDKLQFLLSIINKQFIDEDPKDLSFIANLCYESQRHSIEKSVSGWKSVAKTDLLGNPLDAEGSPYEGAKGSPKQQVEEKEKVEEKVEDKKEKKKSFNFRLSLIDLGVEEDVVDSWMKVRAKKKAVNTEIAFNAIKKQIGLCNITPNECITKAVENSWSGFKAEWIKEETKQINNSDVHSRVFF